MVVLASYVTCGQALFFLFFFLGGGGGGSAQVWQHESQRSPHFHAPLKKRTPDCRLPPKRILIELVMHSSLHGRRMHVKPRERLRRGLHVCLCQTKPI